MVVSGGKVPPIRQITLLDRAVCQVDSSTEALYLRQERPMVSITFASIVKYFWDEGVRRREKYQPSRGK